MYKAVPEVRDMIGRTDQEILAGKIKRTVPPVGKREWLTILAGALCAGDTVLMECQR
jgi:hypothetical protein